MPRYWEEGSRRKQYGVFGAKNCGRADVSTDQQQSQAMKFVWEQCTTQLIQYHHHKAA